MIESRQLIIFLLLVWIIFCVTGLTLEVFLP